ncbi:MAG: TIGR03792 family protein [Acidimicrobiales bacterium]|jgi:uncharacterized protein (TIGR03792 family)|nr:TIGR03792 family protein [Acidimicrobiales bacterium]
MVIEFLTFIVPSDKREEWESLDNEVWTSFLSAQKGFIRKELWHSTENEDELHAVIWWEDKASWAAITPAQISKVDEGMGEFLIEPMMREFRVVRDR